MKNILILLLFSITFFACKTSTYRSITADKQNIHKSEIYQVAKIADYSVKTEKVKGVYSGTLDPTGGSMTVKIAKELAVGNAIANGECDFLVHPLYDITIVDDRIRVSVQGYPATYTSFKTLEHGDSVRFNTRVINSNEVKTGIGFRATETSQAKKKKAMIVGGTYLVLGTLTAILLSVYN